VDQGLLQETVRENAYMENLESHDRYKGRFCAKEGKGVPIVERRKGESTRIHIRTTEERIYLTLKVASNSTGVLCREKGWEEANGTGL